MKVSWMKEYFLMYLVVIADFWNYDKDPSYINFVSWHGVTFNLSW